MQTPTESPSPTELFNAIQATTLPENITEADLTAWRIAEAKRALIAFHGDAPMDCVSEAIVDLVASLMHLAAHCGIDTEEGVMLPASIHFRTEQRMNSLDCHELD